jgi:hypothetical protein
MRRGQPAARTYHKGATTKCTSKNPVMTTQ